MASIKAQKGNPFERLIAYNLILLGFNVQRIDDNTKGIDLIASRFDIGKYIIECKFHKKFSWNELEKVYLKTEKQEYNISLTKVFPIFVFKANQQPILVMSRDIAGMYLKIQTFQSFFQMKDDQKIEKIPKGYKIWKSTDIMKEG